MLNFASGNNQFTSVDPGAVELQRIMGFVEDFWEDVIEDPYTLTVNYWYEDISPLGKHDTVAQALGREIEANVRFDIKDNNGVEQPWWFDPTPDDNSEFNVQQILWRDLTSTQQDDWYNNFVATSVPATFETGFAGNAPVGSPAVGKWDLVTSALHEVGHALGVSGMNNSAVAQTGDGDYDFNPAFIFGQTLAVETDNVSGDDNADVGHLENSNTGMSGGQAALGRRRLPTHTDMFAMAASQFFVDLDVPRREFYGGSDWNNDANWSGSKRPGTADDVYVRAAQGTGVPITARLTADGVAGSLTVSEGCNVDTDGFKLDVTGDVTVSNINSDIFIDPGGELEADEVFIEDDAEVEMSGGTLDARIVKTKPAGQLQSNSGNATVIVSQLLINNGQIEADGGSTLLFSSITADFPWDLDGDLAAEAGIVDASDGSITFFGGAIADPFDGTMKVGAGHTLSIFEPWINDTGMIELDGGTDFDSRARISGLTSGTINMLGGEIAVTGVAHIDAPVIVYGGIFNPLVTLGVNDTLELNGETSVLGGTWTLGNGSNVSFDGATTIAGGTFNTFSTLAADGLVTFNGTTTYTGGTITINGIARQERNATVENATTINADVFDMDGTGIVANHSWTLNDALNVNADAIDVNGSVFGSAFTIDSSTALLTGKLTINLPGTDEWTLGPAGTIDQTGQTNVFSSTIAGSDFNLDGTASVTNNVAWDARADIAGTITINANSNLRLLGGSIADPYSMDGGVISGLGTLSTIGDRALVGFGTIATEVEFFNEAELRADNGTLTVSGVLNDVGVLGTADADGILNVTTAWNTSVTDLVELHGGSIIGSAITNSNSHTIQGFGTLAPNNLTNDGSIVAENGTLTIDPVNTTDLDGSSENGEIDAVNGNLNIIDAIADHFDGLAIVGANRTLTLQSGWIIGAGGELQVNGGTSPGSFATVAGSLQNLHGAVAVDRIGHFDIPTRFKFDVAVSLPDAIDNLVLTQPSTVEAGASFTGLGLLANAATNTLTLETGTSVGVRLLNAGTLEIGASPGAASALAFSQNSTGTTHIELGGTTAGQFDKLMVTGTATLGGTLNVSLINGFVPQAGNSFDILDWGTLSGTFATLDLPSLGSGLVWNVSRLYTQGLLGVALAGDYNFDGAVNAADFVIWRKTDGTLADYNSWRAHFGQTAGAGVGVTESAAVPEPAIALQLLIGILAMCLRRRIAATRIR